MKAEKIKSTNIVILRALVSDPAELVTLADASFWIPFNCTSRTTQFEVEKVYVISTDLGAIQFNAIPTIYNLKVALLRILLQNSAINAIKLLANLWRRVDINVRKSCLVQTAELLYLIKNVLADMPDREDICSGLFELQYHQAISKIDVVRDLLLREIHSLRAEYHDIPKWKGKSMQFIELISIGIELNLFEGQNQNQICNSLLKAFQVDAESDQPIYKQRFNALFKRSKLQLPLIADYISTVEEAKKMKIVFTA